jgi:tRNA threonylcarbamoyladenosine biosynthesis protein TsaE
MFRVVTDNESDTVALGKRLGSLLRPGDFVALFGDLGSGKTRFSQGVALGVGVDPKTHVTSPTYTIMNEYQGSFPLYHFDLYRLAGDADIVELGFEDYFYGRGISLVEWAERLVGELPDEHLKVSFNYEADAVRRIEFEANGERYREILQELFLEKKN